MAKNKNADEPITYRYERINRRWGQYTLLIDGEVWTREQNDRVKILGRRLRGDALGFNEVYELLIAADARVEVQRVATGKTRILYPTTTNHHG